MDMNIQLCPTRPSERKAIRRLYRSAFPRNERKPQFLLRHQEKHGVSGTFSILDGDRFLGFIIIVTYHDMVLLDFFAVSADARSCGIGSRALALLKEQYRDQRLFLEVERPVPDAPNLEERTHRLDFYLRNGMQETGVYMRIYGSEMELMHASRPIAFDEYDAFLRATLHPLYYRIIRPVTKR